MVDNRSAFREIGVVTSGRSDYSISLPLLRCIDRSLKLNLKLLVTGMHLSPHFGQTVRSIESDGFKIYHSKKEKFTDISNKLNVFHIMGHECMDH